MPVLNFDAVLCADLVTEPFRWAHIKPSFQTPALVRQLAMEFPSDGFGRKQRRLGESSVSGGHYLNGRGLITRQTAQLHRQETLTDLWRDLALELLSDEYRNAVSSLVGIDLRRTKVEAILFRQPEGGYLDPHADNPKKPVSHVFYFNLDQWPAEEGGHLRILRSDDIEDAAHELPPDIDTSVILVRSDSSWHGYKPVRHGRERLSMQVFFCEPDMEFATEYGPDWTRPPRITRSLRLGQ